MKNPAKTASEAFKHLGVNFFTQLVIERKKKGRYFYELSTNQPFDNMRPKGLPNNGTVPGDLGPMYGVTVIEVGAYEPDKEKSKVFDTLLGARNYILTL